MAEIITITVHGKTYRISTHESAAYIHEAVRLLESSLAEVAAGVPSARNEQLLLFASLQTAVGLIKQREESTEALVAHATRLATVLAEVE